jgi:hypothetical protein
MSAVAVQAVEGELISEPFPHLYRLLDFDRQAQDAYQRLTMPAAFEILAAYESDEWRRDKAAERTAYEDTHGIQPQWSATSFRTFAKWVQERCERDGHPVLHRSTIENLREAAECYRIARKVAATVATLPDTEWTWRPAAKLLRAGFTDEIADVVIKANDIAEAEGKPITRGIMLAARQEVWRTSPRIREWAEQPGQVDVRSPHDRVVTTLNKIKRDANALRKELRGDARAWQEFLDGLAAIR